MTSALAQQAPSRQPSHLQDPWGVSSSSSESGNDRNKTCFLFLFPGISGRNVWSSEGYFKLLQTEETKENPNIPNQF